MNIDKLIIKEQRKRSSFDLILEMVEDLMGKENLKILTETRAGAKGRRKTVDLGNYLATEISVGQRPGSQDRSKFELWMSNIGFADTPGTSPDAVAAKLRAITEFFAKPEDNLDNATIPETLSYMMFLNSFVYMVKEFNASVAGYLWEPFLAALYGGKASRQVPTSEGDISDIKVDIGDGKNAESVSLKILSKSGGVHGSFTDLVNHFAEGGKNMRYVVLTKDKGEGGEVVGVNFHEFDIRPDNFMNWIGALAHEEAPTIVTKNFKIGTKFPPEIKDEAQWSPTSQIVLRLSTTYKGQPRPAPQIQIRTGKAMGGSSMRTLSQHFQAFGTLRETEDSTPENPQYDGVVFSTGAAQNRLDIKVDGQKSIEASLDDTISITVHAYGRGGKGGTTIKRNWKRGVNTDGTPLMGSDTKDLWGDPEQFNLWSNLAANQDVSGQEFFKAVRGDYAATPPSWQDDPILPAPGVTRGVGKSQFSISPKHFQNEGTEIGTLKITIPFVERFFESGAEKLGDDIVNMFNLLASLDEHIANFFLIDCSNKCTKKQAEKRGLSGKAAIDDSQELQKTVDAAVSGMVEGGEQMDPVTSDRTRSLAAKSRANIGGGKAGHGPNENITREDIIE
tara:strand:- start:869 stop:2725 length:1857 start_codon:yes stop_codon:yes gene_type:complete